MEPWKGTVLVTGATGYLGRRVVKKLVARGIPTRALVRRQSQLPLLEALGAEAVLGDMKERASLEPAVEGVTGLISAAGVGISRGKESPREVDYQGNCHLVDLAVRAGSVRRFVLISMLGAQHLGQSTLFKAKYHAEQYLRQSGLPYTILRPGLLMSDHARAWERGGRDGYYDVIGSPTRPMALVSPDDLAELAVRSLWEPGAFARTLMVTNDEMLTAEHIAAIHSHLFARPIRLRRLPLWLIRLARPLVRLVRPGLADFLGLWQAIGGEVLMGRPEEVRALYPGFQFESYQDYLQRTREA